MADTTNFDFTLLTGSDYAGYTSINTLINSIDEILEKRVFAADKAWAEANNPAVDEVMVFSGDWATNGYWKAAKIIASNIAADAITTEKILDSNVTTAKIADNAVTLAKMADNSVGTAELVALGVTNAKLAADSVTTVKIQDNAVTQAKMADSSVGTAELINACVTVDKLADGSVSAAKLNANLTTQLLPSGMIAPFAGSSAPTGWLLCQGQSLNAVTNPEYAGLWGAIGTTYGGTSQSDFLLPDMSDRVPVGKSSNAPFNNLNSPGGVKDVTLTSTQSGLPAHAHTTTVGGNNANITIDSGGTHSHGITDPGHAHSINATQNSANQGTSASTFNKWIDSSALRATNNAGTGITINDGGSHAHTVTQTNHTHTVTVNNNTAANAAASHTNLQPYIVLNYIIKI